MATKLSVNLNKIALLRNSRGRDFPNLVEFGRMALDAGAAGLTIHPRPDERHARYSDAIDLKALTAARHAELNIEGNPVPSFIDLVLSVQPDQVTLVPDAPDQITSDHGYDLAKDSDFLRPIIAAFKAKGIRVSLFMDPVASQMSLAADLDADRIELYTEKWAESYGSPQESGVLGDYRAATLAAHRAGLDVNAGHDLDLGNLSAFLAIGGIAEVSIGHALTVEALHRGYSDVVAHYVSICSHA